MEETEEKTYFVTATIYYEIKAKNMEEAQDLAEEGNFDNLEYYELESVEEI